MRRLALRLCALAGLFLLSAPAAAQSFAAQFPARILAAHNTVRAQAGVAPLVWDNALGSAAAAYASQMAMTGRFAHSDRSQRRGTGENLWMGTRGAFSVEAMVGGWTSERRWFRPGIFPNVSRTGNWESVGHYTQMIWPTTTRIGCALASTPRIDYLVCRYAGAGNIDGRPLVTWLDRARNRRRVPLLMPGSYRAATYLCRRTACRYRDQTGTTQPKFSLDRRNRTREGLAT